MRAVLKAVARHAVAWPVQFAAVMVGLTLMADAAAADTSGSGFRVGFSATMFTEVNENDAKAAVKAWGQTVAKERNIPTNPDAQIFKNSPELVAAMQASLVDAVGISVVEFAAVSAEVRCSPVFVTYNSGSSTEQYVLLVHQDSKVASLADLRERSVAIHRSPRTSLAPMWLEVLLSQHKLPPLARLGSKVSLQDRLTKTVLPVFFRQCDACVVTRRSFELMAELNPQVGKQLKVIANSDDYVPAVFVFREAYSPRFKAELLAGLRELHQSPSGQQVLTIFQSERLADAPDAGLTRAFQLIAAHAQLLRDTNGSIATPQPGGAR